MRYSAKKITDLDFTRLPPAPHVLVKLIDLCHRSDVSFEELEQVIEKDTALCAKVITLSNSAAYSQWNEVRELKRVLVVLGAKTIKSIALTSAVHQFFSQFSRELGEALGSIWLDALICAHLARKLAELTAYPYPDEAHLAGLIHQLGQLVLLSNDPEHYQKMLGDVPDQAALMFEETKRYGMDSAELGAQIVDQWGITGALSDAIRYQHRSSELLQDTQHLVRLTSLASQLCNRLNHTRNKYSVEDHFFELNQSIIENLVLESTRLAVQDARGFGIEVDEDHTIPRANIDDESIRMELARKVREIALLQDIQSDVAVLSDLSEMIRMVTENLQLVFSLHSAMFFFPDPEQAYLSGFASHSKNIPANGSYKIKLKEKRSLVTDAALESSIKISLNQDTYADLPVIDRQIMSTLKSSQMICLPLHYSANLVGVIAIGCEDYQAERFARDSDLLQRFASVVAESFTRHQRITRAHQQQMEQQQLEKSIRTRKIIHEINNPLSVINNYLELLGMDMQSDSENQQHLETVKAEVHRMSRILLQLKDDEDEGQKEHDLVDINELITRMLEIFKPTLFKLNEIHCDLRLDRGGIEIATDQDKVKQIITNLVKNAAEALPVKGRIHIGTRSLVKVDQHDFIEISIADNGPGLPQHVLDHMFSPVETTKGGDHAGLGLTIVSKLVKELGGQISYASAEQGGAEFVILLPK